MTSKLMIILTAFTLFGTPAMLAPSNPARAGTTLADGEITKIDESASNITIRHGPIKKLDMDGMTMVFRVEEPAMLKTVKVGDKIKFDVERVKGQFTVTKIEKAK